MRAAPILATLTLAGCGGVADPPAEAPPGAVAFRNGTARLDTRTRELIGPAGERVPAGAGPVAIAAHDDRLYVSDRVLGALLVFDDEPELELQRRVFLPGEPTAILAAGDRLLVALTARDEVVELTADGAAKLVARHRTVHRPRTLTLRAGRIEVEGAGGRRAEL